MKRAYQRVLEQHLRDRGDEEWTARIVRSARRLMTAVTFREVAESTHLRTGTVLLAPIGFARCRPVSAQPARCPLGLFGGLLAPIQRRHHVPGGQRRAGAD